MASQTPNLRLNLPDAGDPNWNIPVNENFEELDGLFDSNGVLLPQNGGVGTNSVLAGNIGSGNAVIGQSLIADGSGGSTWFTLAFSNITGVLGTGQIPSLPESKITGLVSDLAGTERLANKGTANGYAPLDSGSKIPAIYLSSGSGSFGAPHEFSFTTVAPGNFQISHGLGGTPIAVLLQLTSGGIIWFQTSRYDNVNINLVASDIGLTGYALAWI